MAPAARPLHSSTRQKFHMLQGCAPPPGGDGYFITFTFQVKSLSEKGYCEPTSASPPCFQSHDQLGLDGLAASGCW